MNRNTLRSIGAVALGLVFIAASHTAIDSTLEGIGVLPKGHFNVGTPLILLVILYRTIFSFLGCYLTARIAPSRPLKHALILGAIGTGLSIVGVVVTFNLNIAPLWYGISLVVIALPTAWLAGSAVRTKNPNVV